MKKFRILSIFLSVTLIICGFSLTSYSEDSETHRKEFSIDFDNESITNSIDTMKLPSNQTIDEDIVDNYMEVISEELERNDMYMDKIDLKSEIEENIKVGRKLKSISFNEVYFDDIYNEETGELDSRLLTYLEVEELKKYGEINNVRSSSIVDSDYITRANGNFTLRLTVWEDGPYEYYLSATGEWDYMGSDPQNYPSAGDDCIAFLWGGEFYDTDSYIRGETFNNRRIDFYEIPSRPNSGIGWSFDNSPYGGGTASATKYVKANTTISKNRGIGERTSVLAYYVHTYTDKDWDFSISADLSGVSVSAGIGSSSGYWEASTRVRGIDY
jgi:hypothetical protein